MKQIKVTEEAYLDGYEGAFLRYRKGNAQQPFGLNDYWYKAFAKDLDGNKYIVIWEIKEDYDFSQPEDEACDWESPYMVIDLNGYNVIDDVTLQ